MTELTDTTTPVDEAPPRRLVRVTEGRWLGGVAAGLGRYFDVNPLVYRIAFVALAFAGGTGILLYLAAWLVMPPEDREDSIAVEALRDHRDRPWLLLGLGLLALGVLFTLSEVHFWPGPGNVWLAAILVGAALVWWHVSNRETETVTAAAPAGQGAPAAARTVRPSLLPPVFGALLAAAGVFGLLAVLDVYDVDLDVALAVGVAVVGAAIAGGALTGRRIGGLVLLGVVLLAGFGVAATTPVSFSSGVGERVERPLALADLERSYELGVGDYRLDLADLELEPGRTRVEVTLGAGELVVTVPADVALEIDARAGIGEVEVLGDSEDGFDADLRLVEEGPTPNAPVLELDAEVGVGHLEVLRG